MNNLATQEYTEQRVSNPRLAWSIYPLSWFLVIVAASCASQGVIGWNEAWVGTNALLIISYIGLELKSPLRRQWGGTWSSVMTDLKYLITNGAILGMVKLGLGLFAINMSGQSVGPASDWPLPIQVIMALVVFEALQYSIHRYMHQGEGRIGRFFWKIHSAHHLPKKLYVTMHVVGHPLNGFFIQTLVIVVPVWLMGYSEAACTLFLMTNSIHGLMSHFNVDARMGWMNYLFVGNELHRFHHSSALREAKNFGAVLSIFDQLFGTFVHRPGEMPTDLGTVSSNEYPDYQDLIATLKYPFLDYSSKNAH